MTDFALSTKEHLVFLRYCIDPQQCIPTVTDWGALFSFMKEQALQEGSGVEVVCSERTDTAEECGDEQEVRGVGRTAKGGRFRVLCAEGTGECGDVSRPIHEGIGRH